MEERQKTTMKNRKNEGEGREQGRGKNGQMDTERKRKSLNREKL